MTGVLLRTPQEESDTHAGRLPWEVWRDAATSPEATGSWDRGLEQIFPQSLQRSVALPKPGCSASGLQDGERVNLCCFKPAVWGALLWRLWETHTVFKKKASGFV